MSSVKHHRHGRNTSNEDYNFYAYKEQSQPQKFITSSPPRAKHHVAFKTDYEKAREYERYLASSGANDGSFKTQEEDINKEADEFIRTEHTKFLSRTMSA